MKNNKNEIYLSFFRLISNPHRDDDFRNIIKNSSADIQLARMTHNSFYSYWQDNNMKQLAKDLKNFSNFFKVIKIITEVRNIPNAEKVLDTALNEISHFIETDTEESEMKKIYSGIFMLDGTHMTYEFNLDKTPSLPKDIKIGDHQELRVIGTYADIDCSCLVVKFGRETKSPFNGNLFHITTSCSKSIESYEVGVRVTKNGYTPIKPYIIKGVWGFSTPKGVIF